METAARNNSATNMKVTIEILKYLQLNPTIINNDLWDPLQQAFWKKTPSIVDATSKYRQWRMCQLNICQHDTFYGESNSGGAYPSILSTFVSSIVS
jgi:hypothetical protein